MAWRLVTFSCNCRLSENILRFSVAMIKVSGMLSKAEKILSLFFADSRAS
jgi:hypothetical protein